jgi:Family of unknown function (DUF5329)
MARLLAIACLTFAAAVNANDRSPEEDARIDYLLAIVASMHDAQFIRNGTPYDGAAAVKHLRLKLRAAGSRVKTAEDFISYCASASSVSGQPYEIRFSDGRVVRSADFLRQKLIDFQKENESAEYDSLEGSRERGGC